MFGNHVAISSIMWPLVHVANDSLVSLALEEAATLVEELFVPNGGRDLISEEVEVK